MNGKIVGISLFLAMAVAGGGMYYAQEYAFYDRIDDPAQQSSVTIETASGPQALTITGFDGIDSDSSPLRWRICATLDVPPTAPTPYEGATPLMAPGWFDCFDARQIGDDLASGAAQAYLSQANIRPDVDRIFAVYPDGRIFGWHQYDEKNPERGVMD